MIGLDTNILARYYIDDANGTEVNKQHLVFKKLIESGKELMVCKTVLLEFEWVMRGFYEFKLSDVQQVFQHLLSLPNVSIENRARVEAAIETSDKRLDFADALHQISYYQCDTIQ